MRRTFFEFLVVLVVCAAIYPLVKPSSQPPPEPTLARSPQKTALYECAHDFSNPKAEALYDQANDAEYAEDAVALVDRALQLEPNNPTLHYHRAMWLTDDELYPEAVLASTRAIELEPGFASAYNQRGWTRSFMSHDDFELGVSDADMAIQLDPEPTNYDTRGYLLVKLGRAREGLPDLDRAVAAEPCPEYLSHRAEAHQQLGNLDKARQDQEKSDELQEKEPDL